MKLNFLVYPGHGFVRVWIYRGSLRQKLNYRYILDIFVMKPSVQERVLNASQCAYSIFTQPSLLLLAVFYSLVQIIVLANLLTKGHSLATPLIPRQLGPTVQLDNAIFVGLNSGPVNQFLGVPFARPP